MAYIIQPRRQYTEWFTQKTPSTTAVSFETENTTLTPTGNGGASAYTDSTGEYINYGTSVVANSLAGLSNGTFTHTQTQFNPIITFVMKTGANSTDLENVRLWIGLFSASPASSDTPSVDMAAFRYATATDGTAFWRCITSDGTTITTTTTAYAIAADTRYVLRIELTASSAVFFINNSLVATHTTNLPTSTTGLNYFMTIGNPSGSQKNLRVGRIHCKQN